MLLWVCFVPLYYVTKEQELLPFVTYYGYCHSLDNATLFSKVETSMSMSLVKHVHAVISSCAPTLYALRTLRELHSDNRKIDESSIYPSTKLRLNVKNKMTDLWQICCRSDQYF